MRAQGLQGVARAGRVAAIVDQQGRSAVDSDAGAERGAERLLSGRAFDDHALRRVGRTLQLGTRRQAEGEGAGRVDADHALGPAGGGADELADGQAVEQFVGDQQQRRAAGNLLKRGRPLRRLGAVPETKVLFAP